MKSEAGRASEQAPPTSEIQNPTSTAMSTDKQIAANQLNAQKSTGPKTPEGRAAVRLNGLKHGLTASTLVLKGENQSEFDELLDSIEAEHQPTTPTEEVIVRQIAMSAWQLRRLHHIEAGFFTTGLIDRKDYINDHYKNLDPGDRLAIVVRNDCQGANALAKISLYGAVKKAIGQKFWGVTATR